MTNSSSSYASEFRISSVRPSAKYSSSGPLLSAANGSTATERSASGLAGSPPSGLSNVAAPELLEKGHRL